MMNWATLRKWRTPSPCGHMAANTAAFASRCCSGASCEVVTCHDVPGLGEAFKVEAERLRLDVGIDAGLSQLREKG